MSYFIKKWFFEVTVNITLLIIPAYLITCSILQYGRMAFSLSMPVTVYGFCQYLTLFSGRLIIMNLKL